MGRRFSKSEKALVFLLIAAVVAAVYYYLFWDNMTKKIEEDKNIISEKQFMYDDYKNKASGLEDLKAQLEDIKNAPSNKDKFYAADENQEVYMDFLQKLADDNELTIQSIGFTKDRAELPAVKAPDGKTQKSAAAGASGAPYFNVTTASIMFYLDFEAPGNLLNALETIEKNEKMVFVNNLTLNIGSQAVPANDNARGDTAARPAAAKPAAARPTAAKPAAAETVKTYNCSANISFVSLVIPPDTAPVAPDTPAGSGAEAVPAKAGTPAAYAAPAIAAGEAADTGVVEVPVATANP